MLCFFLSILNFVTQSFDILFDISYTKSFTLLKLFKDGYILVCKSLSVVLVRILRPSGDVIHQSLAGGFF
jgi:hypothetical protein